VSLAFSVDQVLERVPKLEIIVLSHTTVLLALAHIIIRQFIPTIPTGDRMLRLVALRERVLMEVIQKILCFSVRLTRTTEFLALISTFGLPLEQMEQVQEAPDFLKRNWARVGILQTR
jgi:hypothetical protein